MVAQSAHVKREVVREKQALTVAALCPGSSNQEIVGLDVAIDQILFVDCLHP